jgi:lipoyl(octanoyl) transferase
MAYDASVRLQERLAAARQENRLDKDVLILLEHFPVFTVGIRGGKENLLVDESYLQIKNIAIVSTRRGGNITYHGPGQLVGYFIVDLLKHGLDLRLLAQKVESVLIRTAADFRITGVRDNRNRGVWVGGKKIASIGLAVSRGVSFHGFAINANNDLAPFQWIHPCGLKGVSMTSLSEQRGCPVDIKQLRESVKRHVSGVFDVSLAPASEMDLRLENGHDTKKAGQTSLVEEKTSRG